MLQKINLYIPNLFRFLVILWDSYTYIFFSLLSCITCDSLRPSCIISYTLSHTILHLQFRVHILFLFIFLIFHSHNFSDNNLISDNIRMDSLPHLIKNAWIAILPYLCNFPLDISVHQSKD